MPTPGVEPRFYTLEDVATILNVRVAQVYALVRSGELRRSSSAGVASGGSTACGWRPTSSACTGRRPTGRASTRSSARRRKGDGDDRGEPDEAAGPDGQATSRLAEVVLGELQVVAADRFDGAVAAGPVGQLDLTGSRRRASSRRARANW